MASSVVQIAAKIKKLTLLGEDVVELYHDATGIMLADVLAGLEHVTTYHKRSTQGRGRQRGIAQRARGP